MASSTYEIISSLKRMVLVMRMPKGISFDDQKTMAEYSRALVTFNPEVLEETVNRVLDGRIERKYPDSFPRVTEIAGYARKVASEMAGAAANAERHKMALQRAAENAEHDAEMAALRRDGESQAYMLRLKTAHDAADPWLCAQLIRERHRETGDPIPRLAHSPVNIADDLELYAEKPDVRRQRARYAEIPDAPRQAKPLADSMPEFGGLES